MPIQKLAAPSSTAYYSPGSGSRHTLFASTTVLQAGRTADDAVLAVVTATGRFTRFFCSDGDPVSLSTLLCLHCWSWHCPNLGVVM